MMMVVIMVEVVVMMMVVVRQYGDGSGIPSLARYLIWREINDTREKVLAVISCHT